MSTQVEGLGPVSGSPGVDVTIEPEPKAPKRRGRGVQLFAIAWLGLICIAALVAPLLPMAPYDALTGDVALAPGFQPEFLGTDYIGRSHLSRIIWGARVSLLVGLFATLTGAIVGGALGIVSGYYRGWMDRIGNISVNSMLAFPNLVFLLALAAVLPRSLTSLTFALAFTTVPLFARVARANTLSYREREFVMASNSMGATNLRIIMTDILPNVIPVVMSYSLIIAADIMVVEGSLSFLGFGVAPPQPSWGGMVASGQSFLHRAPWLVFVPAGFFLITIYSLHVLGDRVREKITVRR